MKKHLSSLTFGCLGLCVGFTLCYVYLVLPQRVASVPSPQPQFVVTPLHAKLPAQQQQLEWRPYVIQPMIPPKVVGR
jgi:hypothetical protein